MASNSGPSLAILDDYAGIATRHFKQIPNLSKIDTFPKTLNPNTPSDLEKLIIMLQPYEIISTMRERTPFLQALLTQLPNLKLLLTTGMRNASIDMTCARDRGIIVTGTKGTPPKDPTAFKAAFGDDLPPEADFQSTSQHTWALLLALCSRVPQDDRLLRTNQGAWQSGLAVPLGGKTLGLVGLGRLGSLMARTAVLGFGMKVIAWSENLTQDKADAASEGVGLQKGSYRAVGKEELFRTADVVSVQYVLSDRSRGIVGEKELALMKPSALFINTSRGPLVDEQALLRVLQKGSIRGAALDVFWEEPLGPESPWRQSTDWPSEVVISPHMGYVNSGMMNRWYEEQGEIVQQWLKGEEVQNKIN